ncbi:MAG: hypothetical protein V3W41_21900 [Planctomycetota bacterium]
MARQKDAELHAMTAIVQHIETLDSDQRGRVMEWLNNRFTTPFGGTLVSVDDAETELQIEACPHPWHDVSSFTDRERKCPNCGEVE